MMSSNRSLQNKLFFWIPFVFFPIIFTNFLFLRQIIKPFPELNFIIIAISVYTLTLIILYFVLRKYKYGFKDIGLRDFKLRDIGWAILFFFIAILIWPWVSIMLKKLGIPEWEVKYSLSLFDILISFFANVLIIPMAEEIIFRGFLITALKEKMNIWIACTISIIFFALHHFCPFGIGAFIHILFWAPFPTLLFVRRKSLYAAIVMHIINNLFAYIILPWIFPFPISNLHSFLFPNSSWHYFFIFFFNFESKAR